MRVAVSYEGAVRFHAASGTLLPGRRRTAVQAEMLKATEGSVLT
jgi:hypothetical protein